MKRAIVIGSGFSGLSAATHLADSGFEVTILEKNDSPGGRARKFEDSGFVFDMGPSWYWMPDVFDSYFAHFGKKVSDYYHLDRLDPSYRVFFGSDDIMDLPATMSALEALFEEREPGAGQKLREFLKEAEYKYQVGINDLVYKPGRSLTEFADVRVLKGLLQMHLLSSVSSYVKKYFKNPELIQLLEFPVLFLGATPADTPALYTLMNYADMALGTWYPQGGMHQIVKGMVSLAKEKGVRFVFNAEVKSLLTEGKEVVGAETSVGLFEADVFIAGADYHHVDKHLLPDSLSNYSENYWDKRKMAPSSLIFYLGINKRLDNLLHHNLFFDRDFGQHAQEIYESPSWPSDPLFYVSAPSKTDPSVAPEGCENIFILMPVAPGLEDDEEKREHYYHVIMDRLESLTGQNIRDHVVYKRSYSHRDFIRDYHSFKGNAYGLANTLMQTAILKPSLKNKHLNNLFYTGQLTVPGPGVPPSLISGHVVAKEVTREFNKRSTHEVTV